MKKSKRNAAQLDILDLVMLEDSVRAKVQRLAWDLTVGIGNDAPWPTPQQLESFSVKLERSLTPDDRRIIREEWDKCLASMANP